MEEMNHSFYAFFSIFHIVQLLLYYIELFNKLITTLYEKGLITGYSIIIWDEC